MVVREEPPQMKMLLFLVDCRKLLGGRCDEKGTLLLQVVSERCLHALPQEFVYPYFAPECASTRPSVQNLRSQARRRSMAVMHQQLLYRACTLSSTFPRSRETTLKFPLFLQANRLKDDRVYAGQQLWVPRTYQIRHVGINLCCLQSTDDIRTLFYPLFIGVPDKYFLLLSRWFGGGLWSFPIFQDPANLFELTRLSGRLSVKAAL